MTKSSRAATFQVHGGSSVQLQAVGQAAGSAAFPFPCLVTTCARPAVVRSWTHRCLTSRPCYRPGELPVRRPSSYQAYLQSRTWQSLRARALRRFRFRCAICASPGPGLEVHHREYPPHWGEERMADLTVLCPTCHDLYSFAHRLTTAHRLRRVG